MKPHLSGFRRAQLSAAFDLVAAWRRGGVLVDLGTGTGWLPECVSDGLAVGTDLVSDPRWDRGRPWAVADLRHLPFRDEAADTITAIAALGATAPSELPDALTEISRVLKPGGRLIILVSRRSAIYDRVAIHRVRSRWGWTSFQPEDLAAELRRARLDVVRQELRGGPMTVAAEWAYTITFPLGRSTSGARVRRYLGELDARGFRRTSRRGRYLYLVAERL